MNEIRFSDPESVMRRAIALAEQGIGYVEPNPAVGAVIVDRELNLVSEGCHERFGGPHAEINALRQVDRLPNNAVMYVTLEPCSHHGKTPPCCDSIIQSGIQNVVVGMEDLAPHANGQGIEKLRSAGINVDIGLLDANIRQLNAPFITLMTEHRPYVHAKWAMTLDGKIASRTGDSQWISNEVSRGIVHRLRGRMDAIIVGAATARLDDPLLTARPSGPRVATRIVLDSQAQLALDANLVKTVTDAPVLVVASESANPANIQSLRDAGVEVLLLNSNGTISETTRPDIKQLLHDLGQRGFTNILVEGGGDVLGSFFDLDLIDELHVFIAPKFVGSRNAKAPIAGLGLDSIPRIPQLTDPQIEIHDGDIYIHATWQRGSK